MAANLGIGLPGGSNSALRRHLRHSLEGRPSNYLLLQLHLGEPGRRTWRDWMFLLLIGAALTLIFATPVTLVLWFLAWLLRR